jgi:hypothetical protein
MPKRSIVMDVYPEGSLNAELAKRFHTARIVDD